MRDLSHYIERNRKKQEKLAKVDFAAKKAEYELVSGLLADYKRKMALLETRKKRRERYIGIQRYLGEIPYYNSIGEVYKHELLVKLPKRYAAFISIQYFWFYELYGKLNKLRQSFLGNV